MIFTFRPGPKPVLPPNEKIKKISIYGNGLVAWGLTGGTHHVLTVLETENKRFILLEVEKCEDGNIHINIATGSSESEVLEQRVNTKKPAKRWNSEDVDAPTSAAQAVIDEYHGNTYGILDRDCRRFVDDVCENCGAKIRAKWGLF